MKMMTKLSLMIGLLLLSTVANTAQNRIEEISENSKKNDYAILEVRLNMEDELRTLEGRDTQGMSRIALYTGKNKDKELLSKGFLGYNQVVDYMNEMKANGWILDDTYSITGSFLIINHYVFRKKK